MSTLAERIRLKVRLIHALDDAVLDTPEDCVIVVGRGIDINERKIEELRRGVIPIYEPGLEEMGLRNVQAGRLRFGTDRSQGIDDYDVIVCAVGTPPGENGRDDLNYVLEEASTVTPHI